MSQDGGDAPQGPDLGVDGAPLEAIPDGGTLAGHVAGEGVLLVRRGDAIHAVGAACTHYGGPLGEGTFDGTLVRCPLHHACFRPDTGEAVHAPALDPLPCYRVERSDGRVYVGERIARIPVRASIAAPPASVVVVGGGAAGFAAAEMLRREGYAGPVTIVSADGDPPCDRPNLSKDYLAGSAPEEWMPLRPPEWYAAERVDLLLGRRVASVDPAGRAVRLDDGRTLPYGALLLATGATPVRLDVPGAGRSHVHTLRSMADSRAIVAKAADARRAVVVGASFIGLEVAASLVERKLEVHVVAPGTVPMGRVLGDDLGRFVRGLHEAHGVRFHMGRTVRAIDDGSVTLDDGTGLPADLVVAGIGVRPSLDLAEAAGLHVDRGVLVDAYLRTSLPAIWAAGDIARWPDPSGEGTLRAEHWVVALRQGQTAARNILGRNERFAAVPFFWSVHYDVAIRYVGHADAWDAVTVDGDLRDRDAAVSYRKGGRTVAVATIGRDAASLRAEEAMEREAPGR